MGAPPCWGPAAPWGQQLPWVAEQNLCGQTWGMPTANWDVGKVEGSALEKPRWWGSWVGLGSNLTPAGYLLKSYSAGSFSIGTPLLDHTLRSPGWGPAREPPCWLLPQSSQPDSCASTSLPQMPSSLPTSSMAALIVSNSSGSPFYQQLGPGVLPNPDFIVMKARKGKETEALKVHGPMCRAFTSH